MSATYAVELDRALGARMRVRFTTNRREITDYAVLLLIEREGDVLTIRLYDGAHGINELHRYTRKHGKQPAEVFHGGTLGEGMRTAIEQVKRSYLPMIEGWRTR
jgi:hypothetical protein